MNPEIKAILDQAAAIALTLESKTREQIAVEFAQMVGVANAPIDTNKVQTILDDINYFSSQLEHNQNMSVDKRCIYEQNIDYAEGELRELVMETRAE